MRRFMDCNHNAVDGQETDVTSHAVHCGECGHACSGHCERGACTAPAAVVAVVAGAPGAPGAPATNEELVAAVVEALRSSDPEALRRLVPSDAEVREACPQRGRGFGGPKLEASLARSRSSCSSVLRGARVQVISAVGGGERESSDDEACPNLRQLRNVRAEIDIDGRRVVLVIDDPIRVGKRLAPFDPITCQAAGQEASPGGG